MSEIEKEQDTLDTPESQEPQEQKVFHEDTVALILRRAQAIDAATAKVPPPEATTTTIMQRAAISEAVVRRIAEDCHISQEAVTRVLSSVTLDPHLLRKVAADLAENVSEETRASVILGHITKILTAAGNKSFVVATGNLSRCFYRVAETRKLKKEWLPGRWIRKRRGLPPKIKIKIERENVLCAVFGLPIKDFDVYDPLFLTLVGPYLKSLGTSITRCFTIPDERTENGEP